MRSLFFPTVVPVAASGSVKQALLKWAQKSYQLLSVRISQKWQCYKEHLIYQNLITEIEC